MAIVSAPSTLEPFDSAAWWEPDGFLIGLHSLIDPVRVPYFASILDDRIAPGSRILDIRCGGGFLAQGLSAGGYEITGVDPSTTALRAAQSTGIASLAAGWGERLPFASGTFDAAICSEVLEHVVSPVTVLSEAARVLRPGGVLLFSVPNRTWISRLVLIGLAQRWRLSRVLPPHLHEWTRFIRPDELKRMMDLNGLIIDDVTGLTVSTTAIPSAALAYVRLKTGRNTYSEAGEKIRLRTGSSKALAYLGHATMAGK